MWKSRPANSGRPEAAREGLASSRAKDSGLTVEKGLRGAFETKYFARKLSQQLDSQKRHRSLLKLISLGNWSAVNETHDPRSGVWLRDGRCECPRSRPMGQRRPDDPGVVPSIDAARCAPCVVLRGGRCLFRR